MKVNAFQIPPERWWGLIQIAHADMSGRPEQRVEFMAKRLIEHSESGYTFLLATPLYIALVDS